MIKISFPLVKGFSARIKKTPQKRIRRNWEKILFLSMAIRAGQKGA